MADRLTLSVRNHLAQKPSVTALLGKNATWDTWIFADKPYVKIENTAAAMIVIALGNGWTDANDHNTLWFPSIIVDVWADPDRNPDKSVKAFNADDKIMGVHRAVAQYLHLVDLGNKGMPLSWGTPEQEADNSGALISGSTRARGYIDFSDQRDNPGGRMGSVTYNINQL